MGHTIFGYANEKPSDKYKIFPHRIMMIQFWYGASALYGLELNIQFQPVTLFTAITFYIPNFIESQMAIGRTMIFAGLSIYILFWLRHIPL